MVICNFLDHCQPQAGALGLGRDIGFEGALQDVFRKAAAMVQHAQAHALRGRPPLRLDQHWPRGATGLFVRVLGVLQQVVDHLPQLLCVSHDQAAFGI